MRAALLLAACALACSGVARAQDHSAHGQGTMHEQAGPTARQSAPPLPPTDHAADAYYDPAEMAKARAALRHEAGGMGASKLMIDRLEWRPSSGRDGYAWEAEGWAGGDLDRFAFKSRGEGAIGGRLDALELQGGWSHALDPWFNLRAGIRQDIRPQPQRTYAVIAIEGLAPYWFEVEGELFLSHKGEVSARVEVNYDQRITQSLILQPAAEVNLAAQQVEDLALGSGITSVELGLRLRYEIVREFAPYVGLHWERKLGGTARLARAHGEDVGGVRAVAGIRMWF